MLPVSNDAARTCFVYSSFCVYHVYYTRARAFLVNRNSRRVPRAICSSRVSFSRAYCTHSAIAASAAAAAYHAYIVIIIYARCPLLFIGVTTHVKKFDHCFPVQCILYTYIV